MRPIAAIDCETDPFEYKLVVKPFIWGGYYKGQFRHFKSFDKLLEWLLSFDEKIVVYAHNGGRFDFIFKEVVEQIPDGEHLQIIHGRLARFRIGDLEFRDSLSAVPVSLSKFKKDKFPYWKMKKANRQKYMPEIIKYLGSDCRNLWELISEFVAAYGPSLTLAGASMKQACKLEAFETPKSTAAYFRDLKPFYYGGRVQAFSKGTVKRPIKLWDINSAYPYAMRHDHPWGASYHCERHKGGHIPDQSCVELNAQSLGVFPFGTEKGGTSFPDDKERRDFKVTGWEYNEAKRLGMLGVKPKVGKVYTFHQKKNYKTYVDHFYKLRMESPEGSAQRLFGKLFMNSFYGRTGMDGSAYEQYIIDHPSRARALKKDGWQFREETEDGRWVYFRPEPKERWHFHDVAIALSVTGFVRAMLMRNIAQARKAGTLVHYLDTDGLQTTGNWKPLGGSALGAWKAEKCEKCGTTKFKEGHYAGKKMYAVKCINGHWKKAHKGVVLTGDQIADISNGAEYEYFKDAPSMGILSGTKFIHRKVRATN